jgi:hypothetical protein
VLPLANGAITESLVRAGNLAPRLRRALDGFLTYSARLAAIDRRCSGWVTVPFVLAACFGLLRTPAIRAATGFSPREFPVAAYPHLRPGGRLFAPDKFGGYLIWRSAGARKVFFDGRSDFYGAAFLAEYARMAQARPGWRRDWDSWGYTDALVPADSPLVPALEQCGWRLVYSDPTAVILVGQASRPVTGGEFKAPLPDGRSSDPVRGDRAGAATVRERPWTGQEACPTVRSEWIVKKKS